MCFLSGPPIFISSLSIRNKNYIHISFFYYSFVSALIYQLKKIRFSVRWAGGCPSIRHFVLITLFYKPMLTFLFLFVYLKHVWTARIADGYHVCGTARRPKTSLHMLSQFLFCFGQTANHREQCGESTKAPVGPQTNKQTEFCKCGPLSLAHCVSSFYVRPLPPSPSCIRVCSHEPQSMYFEVLR